MNNTKQQIETLFGNFIVIDADCPNCGAKLPNTEVQPYFIDGLTIYCEECDSAVKASSLTPRAADASPSADQKDADSGSRR